MHHCQLEAVGVKPRQVRTAIFSQSCSAQMLSPAVCIEQKSLWFDAHLRPSSCLAMLLQRQDAAVCRSHSDEAIVVPMRTCV